MAKDYQKVSQLIFTANVSQNTERKLVIVGGYVVHIKLFNLDVWQNASFVKQ